MFDNKFLTGVSSIAVLCVVVGCGTDEKASEKPQRSSRKEVAPPTKKKPPIAQNHQPADTRTLKPSKKIASKPKKAPHKSGPLTRTTDHPKTTSYEPKLPAELILKDKIKRVKRGDTWSYLVSSSDDKQDGQLLSISCSNADMKKITFVVRLGKRDLGKQVLPNASGTWFVPSINSKGNFVLFGLGRRYPQTVNRKLRWSARNISYSYDVNNRRTARGYVMSAGGPVAAYPATGQVAAVAFKRNRIERKMIDLEFWIAPEVPAAVVARARHAKGSGMTLLELHSFDIAGNKGKPVTSAPDNQERQKAIEWIKSHNPFGPHSQIVDDLIFQLHRHHRQNADATLRWVVGEALMKGKNDPGYMLFWENGKFSARPQSKAEAATYENSYNRVLFNVLAGSKKNRQHHVKHLDRIDPVRNRQRSTHGWHRRLSFPDLPVQAVSRLPLR